MEGINHSMTMKITAAERSFLKSMEGGCQIPIGCYTQMEGSDVVITGLVADLTGKTVLKESATGKLEDVDQLANQISEKMKQEGAKEILDAIRGVL